MVPSVANVNVFAAAPVAGIPKARIPESPPSLNWLTVSAKINASMNVVA